MLLAPAPAANAAGDLARVLGANRIETAISICKRRFAAADSAKAVLLARSDQFPDALASASLAGLLNGCVLLVPPGHHFDAAVHAEVDRALPAGAPLIFVGGESALPKSFEAKLKGSYAVERLAGANRYETARLIKERGDTARGSVATAAIIASGENFPDALSASSYAAFSGTPILLVRKASVPPGTAPALTATIDSAFIIGGAAAVGDDVVTSIEAAIGNIAQRISGSDRYATSTAVADFFFATPFAVMIATGTNFPDALAGGPLAGSTLLSPAGMPLLLTKPTSVPPALASYLTLHAGSIDDTTSGYLLGGKSAVSTATEDTVEKLI